MWRKVFFYPKDNTPGCTKEAQAFNENLAQFTKLGAEVIGISSDEDHSDFVSKYGLKMKLLSDVGGKVRVEARELSLRIAGTGDCTRSWRNVETVSTLRE